jgi:hypothetical protein
MKKKEKYHTVRTIPNSKKKIGGRGLIDIPTIQIYDWFSFLT